MSGSNKVVPAGYLHSRVLTEDELDQVSGGRTTRGTLTGGGGGIPSPIVVQPDGDIEFDW